MRDPALWYILAGFSFAMGAVVASFLNVVIWRVPRGESIVSPPSHCPKCNAQIRWYQNVPIVSWLMLRGRCASCKAPISPRYIVVETIGGVLFLAAFGMVYKIGEATGWIGVLDVVVLWVWFSLMIVGTMIDFDHKLLPDFVTIGGMILGVVYNGLGSILFKNYYPILNSVIGLVFGFGLLWLIRCIGSKAFKREAMGMGDVFLIGAVGAISGPVSVLFVIVASSLLGSIVGCSLIALAKTKLGRFLEIPYGPYICAAHLIYLFWGPELLNWYLRLLK